MKIKELEKLINEKIVEKKLNEARYSNYELVDEVRRIVGDLVGNYKDDLNVTDYKGSIVIRKSLSRNSYYAINVKIKKKIVGKRNSCYSWYSCTLYSIVNVSIEENEDYDSLESFIEFHNNLEKEKEEYENNKMKKFESKLSDINIDFKMFYDMMEEYKNLSYDIRQELAKKYGGKDYYKYF